MQEWAGTSWRIVAVGGQPVNGEATISFDDEGRVSGRAVVNRFFGTYTVGDGTLTLGPLGSTMMAGPPEAMAEEHLVLTGLTGSMAVVADPDDAEGGVLLQGESGALRLVPGLPEQE